MRALFHWLLVPSIFSLGTAAWPKSKAPVCVVGAGPAGLTSASLLESKGYETVVFEKQPEVGGKCQAYYEDGFFHPLGAAFYTNASWPNAAKVVAESGVPSTQFFLEGAAGQHQFEFNITTGATQALPNFTAALIAELTVEIPRYAALRAQVYEPFSVPGYKKGVPAALTVPSSQWFAENNFTALPVVVVPALGFYGYGDIRVTPILYTLTYITLDVLEVFVGINSVNLTDFHAVWQKFAQTNLKCDINTNTEITGIDRSGPQPIIKYAKSGWQNGWQPPSVGFGYIGGGWGQPGEIHQMCSAIVLAFPPTITNLVQAGLDLTDAEKEVFDPVGITNYFSSAVKFNLPFGDAYIANSSSPFLPPPNIGEPVAGLRLHEETDIATWWSWGPYRKFEAEIQARELLRTTLSKINKDPANATAMSAPVSEQDVRAFRKWDYFPHYDSAQLKDNFYDKFNALQGQKSTFYASGFNAFENVEWAIRAAQDVVGSGF